MTPARPSLADVAYVAGGGAVGSSARVLIDELTQWDGWDGDTLLVNVVGSFALAVLMVVAGSHTAAHRRARLVLGTGMLGGFSTFSAFVLHVDTVAGRGDHASSVVSVGLGLAAMLVGAAGGIALTRVRRPRGGPR